MVAGTGVALTKEIVSCSFAVPCLCSPQDAPFLRMPDLRTPRRQKYSQPSQVFQIICCYCRQMSMCTFFFPIWNVLYSVNASCRHGSSEACLNYCSTYSKKSWLFPITALLSPLPNTHAGQLCHYDISIYSTVSLTGIHFLLNHLLNFLSVSNAPQSTEYLVELQT